MFKTTSLTSPASGRDCTRRRRRCPLAPRSAPRRCRGCCVRPESPTPRGGRRRHSARKQRSCRAFPVGGAQADLPYGVGHVAGRVRPRPQRKVGEDGTDGRGRGAQALPTHTGELVANSGRMHHVRGLHNRPQAHERHAVGAANVQPHRRVQRASDDGRRARDGQTPLGAQRGHLQRGQLIKHRRVLGDVILETTRS